MVSFKLYKEPTERDCQANSDYSVNLLNCLALMQEVFHCCEMECSCHTLFFFYVLPSIKAKWLLQSTPYRFIYILCGVGVLRGYTGTT